MVRNAAWYFMNGVGLRRMISVLGEPGRMRFIADPVVEWSMFGIVECGSFQFRLTWISTKILSVWVPLIVAVTVTMPFDGVPGVKVTVVPPRSPAR